MLFLDELLKIGTFIADSFMHIWPYLLVTIPLAVAVQMSGASKYIKRAFEAKPFYAIWLATLVGAFSPFCSCGVIPVIASLLISGVPLAPVMSFWIASPSMDPEIFFLSVGMIGWELAVWRLAATLLLSLVAGFITHAVMATGWLGHSILRTQRPVAVQSILAIIKNGWTKIRDHLTQSKTAQYSVSQTRPNSNGQLQMMPLGPPSNYAIATAGSPQCCTSSPTTVNLKNRQFPPELNPQKTSNQVSPRSQVQTCGCSANQETLWMRVFKKTMGATWMVSKFMALAFLIEGLITFYVPKQWIIGALGPANPIAIITAAILGVPVYTSSLTALPMVSGLLTQGMNPAAAIAFLIAGPTTTLPAMAAVWPLVSRRIFILYVSLSLVGAISAGFAYYVVNAF